MTNNNNSSFSVDPQVFRALLVAKGLEFYVKTGGMKLNRQYTPKNMLAVATEVTGLKFKARDYLGAAAALRAHAETLL